MASKVKQHVSRRILERLKIPDRLPGVSKGVLPKHLFIGNSKNGNVELHLPLRRLQQTLQSTCSVSKLIDFSDLKELSSDTTISDIQEVSKDYKESLVFILNRDSFVGEVLNDMINKPNPYGNLCDIDSYPLGKSVIVEYSSPNIAKPFHVGHLRSTIIGNFIAKLHEHLLCRVVKINYLGDWGTQLGLLKVGLELGGLSPDHIRQQPLQHLLEAYVRANRASETDPSIAARARETFQRLEQGNEDLLAEWCQYRELTERELSIMYRRLGVHFNEYAWESNYSAKQVEPVLELLQQRDLLQTQSDGKRVVDIGDHPVPLMKSDGSTLYIMRDIAAALDRFERHRFDEMLYVVDNAQTDHFTALFGVLGRMEVPWAGRLRHVKFGRVRGMSTRKGSMVQLRDILDETRDVMEQRQLQSPNTKINVKDNPEVTDILGVSAIIINDLKQRRQRDYEFDWNRATQVQGDTGVRLQYSHCRLWSLEKRCGVRLPHCCDPQALPEPEVTRLVQEIARFDEVLRHAYEELEACVLVSYLFQLCNVINKAFKHLPVQGQPESVAGQRLMLFHAARLVLGQGMRILGLQPLQEM